jgi:hypothetical protein
MKPNLESLADTADNPEAQARVLQELTASLSAAGLRENKRRKEPQCGSQFSIHIAMHKFIRKN